MHRQLQFGDKFRSRFSPYLDQFGWSYGQQINGKLFETIFPESSLLVD